MLLPKYLKADTISELLLLIFVFWVCPTFISAISTRLKYLLANKKAPPFISFEMCQFVFPQSASIITMCQFVFPQSANIITMCQFVFPQSASIITICQFVFPQSASIITICQFVFPQSANIIAMDQKLKSPFSFNPFLFASTFQIA